MHTLNCIWWPDDPTGLFLIYLIFVVARSFVTNNFVPSTKFINLAYCRYLTFDISFSDVIIYGIWYGAIIITNGLYVVIYHKSIETKAIRLPTNLPTNVHIYIICICL